MVAKAVSLQRLSVSSENENLYMNINNETGDSEDSPPKNSPNRGESTSDSGPVYSYAQNENIDMVNLASNRSNELSHPDHNYFVLEKENDGVEYELEKEEDYYNL